MQGLRLNPTGPKKDSCQSKGTREPIDPQAKVPESTVRERKGL